MAHRNGDRPMSRKPRSEKRGPRSGWVVGNTDRGGPKGPPRPIVRVARYSPLTPTLLAQSVRASAALLFDLAREDLIPLALGAEVLKNIAVRDQLKTEFDIDGPGQHHWIFDRGFHVHMTEIAAAEDFPDSK